MSPGRESRPGLATGAAKISLTTRPLDSDLTAIRRRYAARRDLRHVLEGLRDPQFDRFGDQSGQPSTYGMTADELRRYAAVLRAQGWMDWELCARLVDPRLVAA